MPWAFLRRACACFVKPRSGERVDSSLDVSPVQSVSQYSSREPATSIEVERSMGIEMSQDDLDSSGSPVEKQRCTRPARSTYEVFPECLNVRSLPVMEFCDDLADLLIWEDASVVEGRIEQPSGSPDVQAKHPVAMSPAYIGFAIEPYMERYLHFGGVGIVFARPYRGQFMAPSIDTVVVCEGLRRLFNSVGASSTAEALEFRRALDVGSGSGFIGKFAAVHAPGKGELSVTLVDIDPVAMEYCRSAGFAANAVGCDGRAVSWNFCARDAVQLLREDAGFDLIVSNPPYIPTRAEASGTEISRPDGGFWEGVGLVVFLLELMFQGRCSPGAHLVLMITSLTLKAPAVRAALEAAPSHGVRVQVLLEREMAWKAWFAGPSSNSYLLASDDEEARRLRLGDGEYFVGATRPGRSRTLPRDHRAYNYFSYHWHVGYVLDVSRPSDARRST
eukprot:TRINITY_DN14388_c0_g1_i1.p1 TRINITY_DN14388_c0_g1~~TRINITY_DN14388_c0_g1_i1.p1  ORF type:complete len:447 (+),score=72.39 TRINITY_DN14388_c0_g1_i1:41-1381(+)